MKYVATPTGHGRILLKMITEDGETIQTTELRLSEAEGLYVSLGNSTKLSGSGGEDEIND